MQFWVRGEWTNFLFTERMKGPCSISSNQCIRYPQSLWMTHISRDSSSLKLGGIIAIWNMFTHSYIYSATWEGLLGCSSVFPCWVVGCKKAAHKFPGVKKWERKKSKFNNLNKTKKYNPLKSLPGPLLFLDWLWPPGSSLQDNLCQTLFFSSKNLLSYIKYMF